MKVINQRVHDRKKDVKQRVASLNEPENRLEQNVSRIEKEMDFMATPKLQSDVPDLKQKFMELLQENEELKKHSNKNNFSTLLQDIGEFGQQDPRLTIETQNRQTKEIS
jgi:seryl-tRNA synthetase